MSTHGPGNVHSCRGNTAGSSAQEALDLICSTAVLCCSAANFVYCRETLHKTSLSNFKGTRLVIGGEMEAKWGGGGGKGWDGFTSYLLISLCAAEPQGTLITPLRDTADLNSTLSCTSCLSHLSPHLLFIQSSVEMKFLGLHVLCSCLSLEAIL